VNTISYSIEIEVLIIWMAVKWSHMTGLFVPLAMVVICHHIDPVQVPGNGGDVVTNIHDLLAGTDSGGEKKTFWSECSPKLRNPGSESCLVAVILLLTVSLENI
jgi:hypothetical protein